VTNKLNRSGRLQILIIALVFFGPIILATWMYSTGRLQPVGKTNHGELLNPIMNLEESMPGSPLLDENADLWQLLYSNANDCDDPCKDVLIRLRQIRLMLGSEMDRVGRVYLYGSTPLDAEFLQRQHNGLITISDKALSNLLTAQRPVGLPAGGIYLIDPLDNLIMYFSPDTNPKAIADDLRHLLRLSRIG